MRLVSLLLCSLMFTAAGYADQAIPVLDDYYCDQPKQALLAGVTSFVVEWTAPQEAQAKVLDAMKLSFKKMEVDFSLASKLDAKELLSKKDSAILEVKITHLSGDEYEALVCVHKKTVDCNQKGFLSEVWNKKYTFTSKADGFVEGCSDQIYRLIGDFDYEYKRENETPLPKRSFFIVSH